MNLIFPKIFINDINKKMNEYYLFVKRFFSNPSKIGSILPSSYRLGQKMTRMAPDLSKGERRYLEVGGGSGALTRHLVKKLGPADTLDIVEMDPQFCKALREKFGHLPNVTIHEISILDFDQEGYDVVVTSLPLNSFEADLVDRIFFKYTKLVKPGGYISYFEYMGLGKIKKFYLSGKLGDDFKTLLALKTSFVESYCTDTDKILLNFPPARVFHCQM